jgi:phosphomannomutase
MSATHAFHPTILREYDIRGIVGETLSADDARALGRAFATLVTRRGAGRRICVGRDGRLSSPELEAALVAGLAAGGMEVIRIGLGPTPMLYFSVFELDADGGIMVTGSHNPPDHNGFKMMMGRASFFGAGIAEIGRVAAQGDYAAAAGDVTERPQLDAYIDRLLADPLDGRALTVAWDAGNGAAGEAMARLTARLPGRHILLNEAIDGTFPAHHPDPTVPENLEQLIATVTGEGCDLGIAFDGDGDRIGVVDGEGRILWGDQLLAILAAEVLARLPGATIIADVKASQVLFDEIARLGGKPLMWRTGHSLVKAKMVETGAPLAGEMSGHIFFADGYYGFDDALYAAIRLMRIVAAGDVSLAAMRDRLPAVVNTPELRFPCDEARKFTAVEDIRDRLRADGADFNDTDGVRVSTPDGWWLLRASNTQAVLVARCEAFSDEGLARLKDGLRSELGKSGITPPAF